MSARDIFHDAARKSLENDGWLVTDDPLKLVVGGVDFYIDLGAEQILAAERQGERIAVEIKSFMSGSPVSEFHTALGQFLNYRMALRETGEDRELFLAVTADIFTGFFGRPFVEMAVKQNDIKLLVFDAESEEVVQWIK